MCKKNVHALSDHFLDLPVVNATKLCNHRHYPSDDVDQTTSTEPWLKRILLKFQYTTKVNGIYKEILSEFMKIHQHECENKTMFEAWHVCGSN